MAIDGPALFLMHLNRSGRLQEAAIRPLEPLKIRNYLLLIPFARKKQTPAII